MRLLVYCQILFLGVSPLLEYVVTAAEPTGDDINSKELRRLQGTWRLHSSTGGDEQMQLVFADNKITIRTPPGDIRGTITVDASRMPPTFDILLPKETLLGIYQLEGETLRLCYNERGKPRPRHFKDGSELKVFHRENAVGRDRSPAR
jgi:uncharacterized protein (TIGR03067 family)